VADRLRERFRGVAMLMDEAHDDVLAYMSFHKSHWSQIRSTNPLERLNREVKRRTNVASIFLKEDAIVRLVGAILLEQNDEWAVTRRYMSLETMTGLSNDPAVGTRAIPAT
jgi:transposase-like protein